MARSLITNESLDTQNFTPEQYMTTPLGRRNLIINGGFDVWQRSTSFGPAASNFYYGAADRWMTHGSGGTYTISKQDITPGDEKLVGGCTSFARFDVTTSSDYTHMQQRIEEARSVPSGEKFTISFYAKGVSPTGGLSIRVQNDYTSDNGGDFEIAEDFITLTSSWTRYSLTYTQQDFTGLTFDTVVGVSTLRLLIGQNTNTSTTAWTLDITGVQLELGSVATPFEHRSYGEELALCERYYQVMDMRGVTTHYVSAWTRYFGCSQLRTVMRVVPTTIPKFNNATNYQPGGGSGTGRSVGMYDNSTFRLEWLGSQNGYNDVYVGATDTGDYTCHFDAEL